MIRRIRLFGITVLSIETDDPEPDALDSTTTPSGPVGFVADDLPIDHRRGW